MKRSPFLLSRYPPSPRTPSVISTPAPATPVGWNCQNSMSSRGIPARAAMPRPSPVQMKALVVEEKIRPAPPVAKSVARAQDHHFAGFHLERGYAQHLAAGISNEVERHPFDEKLRAGPDVSLIQRMQHRVTGAVRGAAGALHRPLAEILRMAA